MDDDEWEFWNGPGGRSPSNGSWRYHQQPPEDSQEAEHGNRGWNTRRRHHADDTAIQSLSQLSTDWARPQKGGSMMGPTDFEKTEVLWVFLKLLSQTMMDGIKQAIKISALWSDRCVSCYRTTWNSNSKRYMPLLKSGEKHGAIVPTPLSEEYALNTGISSNIYGGLMKDKKTPLGELTTPENQVVPMQKVFATILSALPCKGLREENNITQTPTSPVVAKRSARIRAKKIRVLGLQEEALQKK